MEIEAQKVFSYLYINFKDTIKGGYIMDTVVNAKEKLVYEAEEIAAMLGMGRSKAYLFIHEALENKGPFKVFKVGKLLRVSKKSFDAWINSEE